MKHVPFIGFVIVALAAMHLGHWVFAAWAFFFALLAA